MGTSNPKRRRKRMMRRRLSLGGTRRVGGLLGVAGRLSGTVSPFRAARAPPPAFPRNPRGRLGFPGPTQGEPVRNHFLPLTFKVEPDSSPSAFYHHPASLATPTTCFLSLFQRNNMMGKSSAGISACSEVQKQGIHVPHTRSWTQPKSQLAWPQLPP